jgi:hypothetical protein
LQSPQHYNIRATTLARTSQTFSPPTSPTSPSNTTSLKVPKTRKQVNPSPRQKRSRRSVSPSSEAEAGCTTTSNRLHPTSTDSFDMLPTPAKTPRKRPAPSEAALKSTARILFPGRPANVEEAMPSPRKTKTGKGHNEFTISTLAEEGDYEGPSNGILIYTDSKERVPSVGGDDNPFLGQSASGKQATSGRGVSTRQKKKTRREIQMEEAARRDEGIIYVL